MHRHAEAVAPEECCGLLIGTADLIEAARPARNDAADPQRRYQINPADHFTAIRQGRALGLDVVGAYHSHPRSEPIPSPTDRDEAFEAFIFIILGPSDTAEMRAWRLEQGNFIEVPLVRSP
jgi:desampylase